jgi:hypothetical protein
MGSGLVAVAAVAAFIVTGFLMYLNHVKGNPPSDG